MAIRLPLFIQLVISWLLATNLSPSLYAQKPNKPSNGVVPTTCGTVTPSKGKVAETNKLAEMALNIKRANAGPIGITHVPIRPHIYRRSNGSGGFSLAALNNVMALTNAYYLQHGVGIQFFFAGTSPNYIDDDVRYTTFNYNDEEGMVGNTSVPNAMNQYYVQDFSNGIGGYAYFPADLLQTTRSFILVGNPETEEDLGNRLIPHELGHNFNLYHTFERSLGTELVTRNTNEAPPRQSANCTTAGDQVCDTPADPYGLTGSDVITSSSPSCLTYTGSVLDANGDRYNPSLTNIMSYYFPCKHDFTADQYTRMQAGLALRQTHRDYNLTYPPADAPAPTNLLASVGLWGGVVLRWQDNATNEMGYFIERAMAAGGPFLPIGGVAPNVSVFTDLKATSGPTYYYRVRPSNTSTGALSNVATVTVTKNPSCRPSFTYGSSATEPDGLNTVVLNGDLLSRNSGSAANGYNEFAPSSVSVSPGQGCLLSGDFLSSARSEGVAVWFDLNRNGSFESAERLASGQATNAFALSLTVPGGVSAGVMAVRIIAVPNTIPATGAACGGFAYGEAEDYVITVQPTSCTAPVGLSTRAFSTSANIAWAIVKGATNYTLRYKRQSSSTWTNGPSLTTTTYSLTGLSAGASYQWQVRTNCGSTQSAWAGQAFGTQCPSGPANPTTSTVQENSAQLTWSGGFTPYELRYRTGPDGDWFTRTGITTTTVSLTGLTMGTAYEWQVRSVCSVESATPFTALASFTTIGYCQPSITNGCQYSDAITSFRFNNTPLSQGTGCSPTAYSLYTAPVVSVTAGASYPFSGTFITQTEEEGVAIWVDLNRNNLFETNERLFVTPSFALITFSGTLTIPAGTPPGPLAVRVITAYKTYPADACGSYSYGETEDYRLQVQSSCTGMASVKDGNWNDPTVWSCGRLPTAADPVQIRHRVTLPTSYTAQAQRIRIDTGKRLIYAGGQLKLGFVK